MITVSEHGGRVECGAGKNFTVDTGFNGNDVVFENINAGRISVTAKNQYVFARGCDFESFDATAKYVTCSKYNDSVGGYDSFDVFYKKGKIAARGKNGFSLTAEDLIPFGGKGNDPEISKDGGNVRIRF